MLVSREKRQANKTKRGAAARKANQNNQSIPCLFVCRPFWPLRIKITSACVCVSQRLALFSLAANFRCREKPCLWLMMSPFTTRSRPHAHAHTHGTRIYRRTAADAGGCAGRGGRKGKRSAWERSTTPPSWAYRHHRSSSSFLPPPCS